MNKISLLWLAVKSSPDGEGYRTVRQFTLHSYMLFKIKNTLLSVFCLFMFFFSGTCFAKNLQPIPEPKKLRFEQVFAEQCVTKEIRNSVNKDEDRLRFSKPCSCIAKRITIDLSAPDMEKFLLERKITHALSMSFDEAAYFCVQKKKRPKSPALFGRQ